MPQLVRPQALVDATLDSLVERELWSRYGL
jgi:hypothetical protein